MITDTLSMTQHQPLEAPIRRLPVRWLPVLLYHRVVDRIDRPNPYHLEISTGEFDAQMKHLSTRGFQAITLDEVPRALASTSPWTKPVAISFDDGYRDTYKIAYPILRKYGFVATIMLVSECIGGRSTWAEGKAEVAPLLSAMEIHELARSGMRFGAHGATHASLPDLSIDQARKELTDSKRALEELLGYEVGVFAYPYGRSTPQIQRAAEEVGYAAAFGVDHGSFSLFNYSRIDAAQHAGDSTLWRLKVGGIYETFRKSQPLRKLNDWRKNMFQ